MLELGAVDIVPLVNVTDVMSVFAPLMANPVIAPPRVKLPLLVTVPVKVKPLTVPVPLTDVTEPLPLLLNVVQSVEDNAPLLLAEAVGTFKVITGVVVPVATVLDKSAPVVPNVSAATLVTVPPNDGLVFAIVKLG